MNLDFCFAQISDLHLTIPSHAAHRAQREQWLAGAIAAVNAIPHLDAVLVTGDLVDYGLPAELDRVIHYLQELRVPWYAIPGNHDTAFPPHPDLLDRRRFYEQVAGATPGGPAIYAGAAEVGSWTAVPKPGVRLVGLDSTVPGTWGGAVDDAQLAWLDATLTAAREPLVVLAVHHPLYAIFGGWERPSFANQPWTNFFCENGAAVRALLDRYPQVRVVVSGHVHISRVQALGGQLFVATPALSGYPLAYRTVQVQGTAGGWTCAWQTHSPAAADGIEQARLELESTDLAQSYHPAEPQRFSVLSQGTPADQEGSYRLTTPLATPG
ncbi:MAG TPA: metallophosphoesterase [Chloroflexia bacterium]|nr:metallophosphoesterase [Chloroflexia bacterium]